LLIAHPAAAPETVRMAYAQLNGIGQYIRERRHGTASGSLAEVAAAIRAFARLCTWKRTNS